MVCNCIWEQPTTRGGGMPGRAGTEPTWEISTLSGNKPREAGSWSQQKNLNMCPKTSKGLERCQLRSQLLHKEKTQKAMRWTSGSCMQESLTKKCVNNVKWINYCRRYAAVPRTKAAIKLDICPKPLMKRMMMNTVHVVEKTWTKVKTTWTAMVTKRTGFLPNLKRQETKHVLL